MLLAKNKMTDKQKRLLVIPGEVIAEGDELLPGEGTSKENGKIVAKIYGLSEINESLVRVIPVSGAYLPRRGNVIIGEVVGVTGNGWLIDVGAADNAFLSIMEVPRYVDKNALREVFNIGDSLLAKIWSIGGRGMDLSVKMRGFGKLHEGIIFAVNPNKIPRIIGKEGSMINLIKDKTGCNISVGQNGQVWIKGQTIGAEVFAKNAITFIDDNSQKSGLTEEVTNWFDENTPADLPKKEEKEEEVEEQQ